MSLYGSLMINGISANTISNWDINIGLNFIVALPLQVFIARPLIGTLFRALFPIGTIVQLSKNK